MGASYSGSTAVSKTVSVGSIPTSRADIKKQVFACFLFLCDN